MISFTADEVKKNYEEAFEEKLMEEVDDICSDLPEANSLDEGEMVMFQETYMENNRYQVEKQFKRSCQPGTYNCHEALDTSSKVMDDVLHLLEHDSIVSNFEWYKPANEAHTALFNLYQAISEKHLDAIPDNMLELIEAQVKKNETGE